MARETAMQRNARLERERLAREEAERKTYPARLMLALDRATTSFNYELTVQDQEFVLRDRDADRYSKDTFYLSYAYDSDSYQALESLEYDLNEKAAERAERERRVAVKKEAERKVRELLSDEERELLGL